MNAAHMIVYVLGEVHSLALMLDSAHTQSMLPFPFPRVCVRKLNPHKCWNTHICAPNKCD